VAEIYAANVVPPGPACPDCLGDGIVPIADGYADSYTDCSRCGGVGWLAETVDDADHAEYVDPIDHTHDAPLASSTAADRLTAVLDIHRPTSNGVCQAEMHLLHPCPTARAALGIR
jgi:hypothetical protein